MPVIRSSIARCLRARARDLSLVSTVDTGDGDGLYWLGVHGPPHCMSMQHNAGIVDRTTVPSNSKTCPTSSAIAVGKFGRVRGSVGLGGECLADRPVSAPQGGEVGEGVAGHVQSAAGVRSLRSRAAEATRVRFPGRHVNGAASVACRVGIGAVTARSVVA